MKTETKEQLTLIDDNLLVLMVRKANNLDYSEAYAEFKILWDIYNDLSYKLEEDTEHALILEVNELKTENERLGEENNRLTKELASLFIKNT